MHVCCDRYWCVCGGLLVSQWSRDVVRSCYIFMLCCVVALVVRQNFHTVCCLCCWIGVGCWDYVGWFVVGIVLVGLLLVALVGLVGFGAKTHNINLLQHE